MPAGLERMRAGDAACGELLRSVSGRLERLARKLLRGFPRVSRWVQTGDVLRVALTAGPRARRERGGRCPSPVLQGSAARPVRVRKDCHTS